MVLLFDKKNEGEGGWIVYIFFDGMLPIFILFLQTLNELDIID